MYICIYIYICVCVCVLFSLTNVYPHTHTGDARSLPDGSLYQGPLSGGQPHGKGKKDRPSGEVFWGDFKNSEKSALLWFYKANLVTSRLLRIFASKARRTNQVSRFFSAIPFYAANWVATGFLWISTWPVWVCCGRFWNDNCLMYYTCVSAHMYMYIYVHIYTYLYICIHTYTYECIYMCKHIYI